MVAVHGVEPHAEGVREGGGELHIPRKRKEIEPVRERHESAVPIVDVHVPRVDAVFAQQGRALLGSLLDAGEARRVDNPHVREPPSHFDDPVDLVVTQPESVRGKTMVAGNIDDAFGGGDILHIDAEVDDGSNRLEVLGESRNMGRQIPAVHLGKGETPNPAPQSSVVVEDDHTVLRDPRIGFHAARTELDRELKGMNRVLRGVRSRTSVGESNRVFATRGQALLHARRIEPQSYAERVFNLSGSEIIFLLLAGLVVLGPERLPGVIRTVGRIYGQVRGIAQGLEKEIKDTFAEPVTDLKNTAQQIRAGFGEVDTEPSPPMRPEMARNPDDAVDGTPDPENPPS